jgi:hypothetical protein
MKLKEDFLKRGLFTIGNGESARFLEDTWLGDEPLAQQYPSLYNIVQRKQVLVANVMSQTPLNIGFRQALTSTRANRWLHLCGRFMSAQLTQQPDTSKWRLTKSGSFSVKSMYISRLYGSSHSFFKKIYLEDQSTTEDKNFHVVLTSKSFVH